MSAFGNDCHFYYSTSCAKGDTCSFRHSEAARGNDKMCMFWKQNKCTKPNCHFRHADLQPTQRNRGEIPCYWENQPVGCSKTNCPFKHFKTRPVNSTDIESAGNPQPEVVQQSASREQAQMIVHPVVVNMAEDSDVEMMSPSKNSSPLKPVPRMTEARLNALPNSSTQFLQRLDVDDSQIESQAIRQRRQEPSQSHRRDLRQMIPDKVTAQKATVLENPPQNKNVVVAQPQPASQPPRISVKQRLNSGRMPAAQKVSPQREAVNVTKNTATADPTLTQNNQPRVSVKERLQMGGPHRVNNLETKKLPVHQRLALAKKTAEMLSSDSETEEDSDVEVKSLEQIQREKALRSMGLIELKNGKVVKISEKENMKQSSDEKLSSSDDDEEFEKDDEDFEKNDKEFEEIEKDDESASEDAEDDEIDEEEEVIEEEVEEEFEDPEIELEEPEIEIYEPRVEIQDTRKAVQKDKISLSEKVILDQKKSPKRKGSDSGSKSKKKRRVIIDDEEDSTKTPDLKPSLIKRLGKRVEPDDKLLIRVGNTNDGEIRRTLTEPVGSTNRGTIKVVTGIKSRLGLKTTDSNTEKQGVKKRLGWRKKPTQATSNDEDSRESGISVPALKKRGWRKKEIDGEVDTSEGTESDGSGSNQGTLTRKRTWRKTLIADDNEKEIDDDIPVSETRPYSVKDEEKKKRKEDPGAKVQDAITQRWKNLGVWSSRSTENKKAPSKRPEFQLDKLGLGIIDIQGGKVVKIGKTGNKSQDSLGANSKQGDEWVMASKQKLLAAKNKKERQIYVPPGRKREEPQVYVPPGRKREADSSISDRTLQAVSPPKQRATTENSNDGFDDSSKEEPAVKTFAQIMAAKSQRQKRKLEKEKLAEKAKNKKITPVSLGVSDDISGSSPQLPDNAEHYNVVASSSSLFSLSSEPSDTNLSKKKLSKWKRKSKNNTSAIDTVVPTPTKNLNSEALTQFDKSEPTLNVRQNDAHILSQDDVQSSPVGNELVQSEKSALYGQTENHMWKTSTESSAENKEISLEKPVPAQNDIFGTESVDDFSLPGKRVNHSLSDSWLDFDTSDICGETPVQDDDDLLKEIDELLA